MTGMRLAELVGLTWDDVDLDALGDDGEKTGEIRLRSAGTKTGRGRLLDLSVSASLRRGRWRRRWGLRGWLLEPGRPGLRSGAPARTI
jgi:integrase